MIDIEAEGSRHSWAVFSLGPVYVVRTASRELKIKSSIQISLNKIIGVWVRGGHNGPLLLKENKNEKNKRTQAGHI